MINILQDMVLRKRRDIFMNTGREPKLEIYIDYEAFNAIMKEMTGELTMAAWSMRETHGEKFMGYPVFRVMPTVKGAMHIRVFDVQG